ncbi:iron complex outermembrane recepter protein [Sphingomonas gellani]|uniref:Iron complex outermembrane recepter protein n=1 Tax=Sphingomonas gellani TaxID=1166340 RepID=A0A1H8DNE8_9SPHN|nr:TonB-dependent receptor [Sphingomonas gellani]SEN08760.1 iron complex outermembrane recepter protein [Sphingomonas gellani]
MPFRRLILASGLLCSPVLAQDATSTADWEPVPDVVVIGRGLALPPGTPAYGSSTIERDRLTGDASGRVEDVLADVAGVQQFRRSDSRSANPSAQGLTLRALGGNASSRALVLLDGVPIADPFFGYIPFTALSPERLGAVRITRGGGSGPFGAGAVAGTVELVSASRAELPPVSARASLGSFDSAQISAAVSPNLGSGYVTLFGRAERSDGFFTTPENQRVAATARARFRDWSTGLRAVAPIDAQTELQMAGLVFDDHRTLRFQGADSRSQGQDASLRLIHRGEWQVDALAYLQARNFANKVISATSFRLTLDQRNTPSTGYGGKVEVRPPVGPDHVLRIGVDTRISDGRLYETAYSGATGLPTTLRTAGGHETTSGAFVEDDWTIGRLVLTGGGRVDRWTIDDGFLRETTPIGRITSDNRYADRAGTIATARAGALWHLAAPIDLRAAGYTGFRVPTLNELYRPFVVFPVTTQANAALGLERLKGVEGGVDLHPASGLTVGLTGFYNRLNGAIANVTIGPNLRQRRNVDAIVAKGVEATLDWRHGAMLFDASYALNDSEVRAPGQAFDGLVPAQSPRHAASATLGWAPHQGIAKDALLSATLRHVGRQFEDDLQTDALKAATTVDALACMPVLRGVAVEMRAENLFDVAVQTRNQAGSIDLGTPRTLWIGLVVGGH